MIKIEIESIYFMSDMRRPDGDGRALCAWTGSVRRENNSMLLNRHDLCAAASVTQEFWKSPFIGTNRIVRS